MSGHNGKDSVVIAQTLTDNSLMIIKSRVFTLEELLGVPIEEFIESESEFLNETIPKAVDEQLVVDNRTKLFELLSPWPIDNVSLLNKTELVNYWFLIQQNEYVLSKSKDSYKIFPSIKSTCGHFYSVEYLHEIIDWSYFVPPISNFMVTITSNLIMF